MMISHDNLLTVAQVARRLQVHEITVRRHIKAGVLKAVRIGRGLRVREEDLDAFIQPAASTGFRLPYRWPPTPEDIVRRTEIIEGMLATRARMKPLGMTTAELIREGRDELERRREPGRRLGG
jgi:excisionase family DNA binding protein